MSLDQGGKIIQSVSVTCRNTEKDDASVYLLQILLTVVTSDPLIG